LRDSATRLGLDEDALRKRLDSVLQRKAAAARERDRRERPPFSDEGVVLVEHVIEDRFVVWGPTEIQGALRVDAILAGGAMPDLANVRLHRAPGDHASVFEYLCELLMRVHRGELRPGHVAVAFRRGENLPTVLNGIDVENPPMNFDAAAWQLIRHPLQTQSQFDRAMATLAKTLAERHGVAEMKPTTR
jgi:hypothetical protein